MFHGELYWQTALNMIVVHNNRFSVSQFFTMRIFYLLLTCLIAGANGHAEENACGVALDVGNDLNLSVPSGRSCAVLTAAIRHNESSNVCKRSAYETAILSCGLVEDADDFSAIATEFVVVADAVGLLDVQAIPIIDRLVEQHIASGDLDSAEDVLSRAMLLGDGRPETLPSNKLRQANIQERIAEIAFAKGDYRRAEGLYQRAYQLYFELFDSNSVMVIAPLQGIGHARMSLGDFETAGTFYERAAGVSEVSFGRISNAHLEALKLLHSAVEHLENQEWSSELKARIEDIQLQLEKDD